MEPTADTRSPRKPSWMIGVIAAVLVAAVLGFAWQHNSAAKLEQQNQQMTAVLQQTQAQLDLMKAKLDSLTQPPPAPVAHAKASAGMGRRGGTVHTVHHRRPVDDPRWKQMQSRLDDQGKQLDEYGKQIDATRQDLSSAKTELTGSIARTHGELVALERKGERSYFEFDLTKTKQFRATGPVGIRLKKANQKHSYADLELMVDDADLSKKHVNLYEPVVFYASDEGRPVELVINSISKDHIHGYVATPKYKKDELAAMAAANNGPAGPDDPTAAAPPARKKLELPKD